LGLLDELQRAVCEAYDSPTPILTPRLLTEAAAFSLFSYDSKGGDLMASLLESTSLSFASDAFVESRKYCIEVIHEKNAIVLTELKNLSCDTLLRGRPDRVFHSALLGASPHEVERALEHATNMRAARSLEERSILSALFLKPEWIDEDILSRLKSPSPMLMTPEMILAATNTSAVSEYLRKLDDRNGNILSHFEFLLLEKNRDKALAPVAAYIIGRLQFWSGKDYAKYVVGIELKPIFKIFSGITGIVPIIEAQVELFRYFGLEKVAKSEDPRPAALEGLKLNAELSLQLLEKYLGESWAQDLSEKIRTEK